jgi:5-methylthioadenosine/S-adenosylhomocysteine deaminase
MRLAALLARARSGPGALTAWDVLAMATSDGAKALRADAEIGSLTVDKRADIVVLDAERLAPGGDEATRIVFGGGSRAVRDVIVDGKVVVRNGSPATLDAPAARAAALAALPALASRAGLAA